MFVLRGNSQSSCNPLQRWPDRIEAIIKSLNLDSVEFSSVLMYWFVINQLGSKPLEPPTQVSCEQL